MKIELEFLSMPSVVKKIGHKTIDFDLRGNTIDDLVQEMSERYGDQFRQFLLDKSGALDPVFKIMINKKKWIPRDRLKTPLQDGDRVTFMMLVAGG
jgi:molybdopterin converting factor small subunit